MLYPRLIFNFYKGHKEAGEPNEEEMQAIQNEFEEMCEIIYKEGKRH
jgi:hypothetical protein